MIKKHKHDALLNAKSEILAVAESVSREKGIPLLDIIDALESALQKAAQEKYGTQLDIQTSIHAKTGEIQIFRRCLVVEKVNDQHKEISLAVAQKKDNNIKIGDTHIDILPSLDFNRISAQGARDVIVSKVKEAERRQRFEEFKSRLGSIVTVTVKRVERHGLYVEIGQTEAMLAKEEMLPREHFRIGDRVRAIILNISAQGSGPVVFLSRTHPDFMRRLFELEVPEILDGLIEIKSAVRDPGSRAKIAVYSRDPSIDPVGSCVGPRGSRIQSITAELRGEKIDVIPWSPNLATFVLNALAPAEVLKVVTDEDSSHFEVVIPDGQLSSAIGRYGQNIKLIRSLTNTKVTITSQADAFEKQTETTNKLVAHLIETLKIDQMMAHLLVAEGFESVEEIASVDINELLNIGGLSEETAHDFKEKALTFLREQEELRLKRLVELGVQEDIILLGVFDLKTLVKLAEEGIKSLEDLLTLNCEELVSIIGEDILLAEEAYQLLADIRKKLDHFDFEKSNSENIPSRSEEIDIRPKNEPQFFSDEQATRTLEKDL
jgi:N utilization substance protein A